MTAKKEHKRKTLIGKVVKVSTANTIKVEIESKYPHPKYGKIIKHHNTYMVNDSGKIGEINIGDIVKITECPPVSKMKKWEVIEKMEQK